MAEIITISFKGVSRKCYAGQLVIKVKPDLTKNPTQIAPLIEEILGRSVRILKPFDARGMGLIEIGKETNLPDAAATLEKNQNIVFAEPNDVTKVGSVPSITPNDPLFAQQWGLMKIQAPAAWGVTQGSGDVVIAVIDTGIPMMGSPPKLSHEDLSDPSRIFLGTNQIDSTTLPIDDYGHGTHVAGIAAAQSNNGKGIAGVNWKCHIFICKAFDKQGSGSSFDLYKAAQEAIAFAKTKKWRLVINYSGGSRNYSSTSEEVAKIVQEGGALLCASAGNDASTVGYPAAFSTHLNGTVRYANVIAVSATTRDDGIASFSNRGIQINVAAPGVDILSSMPNYHVTMNDPPESKQMNYDFLDGTSMACPFVTGLAALVWGIAPNLTASQVREHLQSTALDLPPPGRDPFFGFGRINAYTAVHPEQPPPPPVNPWEDPNVRQWIDEWIQQADRCLKKKHPAAYIDRWGRACGNFGSSTVACNQSPQPSHLGPYYFIWFEDKWVPGCEYFAYTPREYIEKRRSGASFSSLAKCK